MSDKNNYTLRFRPDFRYVENKMESISLNNFKSTTPTVTDTEAYKITLASLRGELAQGTGRKDVGSYSIKPGEEYNPAEDFSFINRPDVTIVQVDEYIKSFRKRIDKYDAELAKQIELELAHKKESLSKDESKEEKEE